MTAKIRALARLAIPLATLAVAGSPAGAQTVSLNYTTCNDFVQNLGAYASSGQGRRAITFQLTNLSGETWIAADWCMTDPLGINCVAGGCTNQFDSYSSATGTLDYFDHQTANVSGLLIPHGATYTGRSCTRGSSMTARPTWTRSASARRRRPCSPSTLRPPTAT